MAATIIDGKAIAQELRGNIATAAAKLAKDHGIVPGLAVVLVGNDPASEVYVKSKSKAVTEAGMKSFDHKLPADTSQADVLKLIEQLNADKTVHGILVQLPLPAQIDSTLVLNSIDPGKDVDGFHPVNAGRLATGQRALVPCTPVGSVILAKTIHPSLSGLDAVVIGRSNIVGKPMAQLLLAESCTVTIAHSRTKNLEDVVRRADIVVAAVGRPEMVKGSWIKPGATVIDVGINRLPPAEGESKGRLVGDVDYAQTLEVAGAVTPVPGGVGPMTIAVLLRNALVAAHRNAGVALADGAL